MSSVDDFHRMIHDANERGLVEIGVGLVQLNRPGSPVYRWSDHNLPALLVLAAVVLTFVLGGWKWGLVSLVCGVILVLWQVRKWGFKRLRERTLKYVFSSTEAWMQMWDIGALSIRLKNQSDIYCMSPRDNWVDFARQHLLR